MSYAQTLSAAGVSDTLLLNPGEVLDFVADTSDLDDATLYFLQSRNGVVFTQAYDVAGAAVAPLVGDAGANTTTVTFKNEGTGPLFIRTELVETGTLAGTVDLTGDAPATVYPETTIVVPEYADNTAALAAGAPINSVYTDGTDPFVVVEE